MESFSHAKKRSQWDIRLEKDFLMENIQMGGILYDLSGEVIRRTAAEGLT